jgi:hypothetical protein
MKNLWRSILCLVVTAVLAANVYAEEPDLKALVMKLGSDQESDRDVAIKELLKTGQSSHDALRKIELTEKMLPQQAYLLRRIIGDQLIAQSPLKPLDTKDFEAFDKDKGEKAEKLILVDKANQIIVMEGEFCLEGGALEYLVVSSGPNAKKHESLAMVHAAPRDIALVLLANNYTYAGELGDDGTITLPPGAVIMISIQFDWQVPNAKMKPPPESREDNQDWKKPTGELKTVRVPIEFLAYNLQKQTTMRRNPFAFTGSRWEKDENGKMYFMADQERSVVAIKADPYALINTPMDTSGVDPQHAAGYEVNRFLHNIRETKCRVVFEVWTGKELKPEDRKDTGENKGTGAPPPTKPGL